MTLTGAGARHASVIGSGPAALTVAIALARNGWAVQLASSFKRKRISRTRIDVLSGSTSAILSGLGISRSDMAAIARPCPGTWSRWGSTAPTTVDYLATLLGHAWSVERAAFDQLLMGRAVGAGVEIVPIPETGQTVQLESSGSEGDHWRILAFGALSRRTDPQPAQVNDDELIGLVATMSLGQPIGVIDARLSIEAVAQGWVYSVGGRSNLLSFGVITDRIALAGQNPQDMATSLLMQSERLAPRVAQSTSSLSFHAVPIPCRWLPFRAGSRLLRVGDAQASFDPISGRGLWEAIHTGAAIASALNDGPHQFDAIERDSATRYRRYLIERLAFYHLALQRFGSGFWQRRCIGLVPLPAALEGRPRAGT